MNSATTFDTSTGVIDFSITVAGKAIPCRVTEGWLRQAYGPAALDDGALAGVHRPPRDGRCGRGEAWLASQGAEPVWLKNDQVWRQPGSARRAPGRIDLAAAASAARPTRGRAACSTLPVC